MAKFRKKPVVIEAFRLNERGLIAENWFWDAVARNDIITHCFGKHDPNPAWCEIKTLEGTMIAKAGDYIIQGVNGEIYPCKADIFQKTYTEDKPKTNADRIRAMSDEILAQEMIFFCPTDTVFKGTETYEKPHYTGLDGSYYSTSEELAVANLKWLKQSAEGE